MSRIAFACFVALVLLPAQLLQAATYRESIYGYNVTSNLTYGTGATAGGNSSIPLRLDLYRPTDIGNGAVPENNPALVLIHGGGFTSGNKSQLAPLAQIFATFGYTVATINYRLAGQNAPFEPGPGDTLTQPGPPFTTLPFPEGINIINAAVSDANKAMQWMHDNAAAYGFDAERIGIGGASAGAVTALLQAYNNPAPEATPKVVLSYLGSMYGSHASIQTGDAPAFIVAGSLDTVVPPQDSVFVANELTAKGVYNEFYMQQGVGHTVDYLMEFDGKTLVEHQIEFLATYLVPEPGAWVLAVCGGLGFFAAARRRTTRRATHS